MDPDIIKEITRIFSKSHQIMGPQSWKNLMALCGDTSDAEGFVEKISEIQKEYPLPDFLPELAVVEWALQRVQTSRIRIPGKVAAYKLNPTLELIQCRWQLSSLFESAGGGAVPEAGFEFIMIWRHPLRKDIHLRSATEEDLLAVKMIAEGISVESVAGQGDLTVGQVEELLKKTARKGLLLAPPSRIKRDPKRFTHSKKVPRQFFSVPIFTIQWHITHACDLHCKHCYDRSKRSPLSLNHGLTILKDFHDFCKDRWVSGHVCFTGGNPFLYPHFYELYQSAVDRGFSTSILGNPVHRSKLEKLLDIQYPRYFQVSLEGLPKHNDYIRGKGNFASVIEFLGVLRDLSVPSAVMLTLTNDNMDQILPLAERLRGHTDRFTFNRLSMVGEGAELSLPEKGPYESFLREYIQQTGENAHLNIKDNLINIIRLEEDQPVFGGCTGYGCGAAFSFLTILPDGEVHACRKFPSPIGNVLQQDLADIYDSVLAEKYRNGSTACDPCLLKPVCGGCLAVAHSYGLDVFRDKDPHCFYC